MRTRLTGVAEIVAMGQEAVPLLIASLDDCRASQVSFNGGYEGGMSHVPVGYLCLDILVGMVEHTRPMFYTASSPDDGLGASWGLNDGYYFRPDDYVPVDDSGARYIGRAIVRIAQDNWQRAHDAGRVRCSRPQ
jgi:hypothetical protein